MQPVLLHLGVQWFAVILRNEVEWCDDSLVVTAMVSKVQEVTNDVTMLLCMRACMHGDKKWQVLATHGGRVRC